MIILSPRLQTIVRSSRRRALHYTRTCTTATTTRPSTSTTLSSSSLKRRTLGQTYRLATSRFSSTSTTSNEDAMETMTTPQQPTSEPLFQSMVLPPETQFSTSNLAGLAESSVLGSVGKTVALATLTSSSSRLQDDKIDDDNTIAQCLRKLLAQNSSSVPLTLDYRQRHHAVGKIPTTAARTDNRRPTTAETLAGRGIDRSLRPLLKTDSGEPIHVACSIQACPLETPDDGKGALSFAGGNPVSLALNVAAAALRHRLKDPVAAVYLCVVLEEDDDDDNTKVLVDPPTKPGDAICELLYAGTRQDVVMVEYSGLLPEAQFEQLLQVAHDRIQPKLDAIENQTAEDLAQDDSATRLDDENAIRLQLGLPPVGEEEVTTGSDKQRSVDDATEVAQAIYNEALDHCRTHLREASLKAFGVADPADSTERQPSSSETPTIHKGQPLIGKFIRGTKERILHEEIERLLQTFTPTIDDSSTIQQHYETLLTEHPSIVAELANSIHSTLLKEALREATTNYHCRADGRGPLSSTEKSGCVTIRPLSINVPALPDVVHGSSTFQRGETQVLCTVTLGPPKDGILLNDPFHPPQNDATKQIDDKEQDGDDPFRDLPVGSMRYLRTQEYMISDLNSRKVRADREQTGDSGQMKERQRAFLQYDFPSFSKGELPMQGKGPGNRREIGHGALAERAILPILPAPKDFPYCIRMTSEVTSSNGSSSMASVCGATLALLDAGVPITNPVAGVSVGLVLDKTAEPGDGQHQLLLDITGTEDYLGAMDFKIAGTLSEVTALQLDVKEPLPLSVIVEAMELAREGRVQMLREMTDQAKISSDGEIAGLEPRGELKDSAPRVEVVRFDPQRKKDLLGPGGVVIRQLEDRFNVSLDLTQEGQCLLYGDDKEVVRAAKAAVMDLVSDVAVGGVYEGTVIEVRDFGVIVELLRNKEGLCHVSELADRTQIRSHPNGAVGLINSLTHVGKRIQVECTAVDPVQGTIRVKPVSIKDLSADK